MDYKELIELLRDESNCDVLDYIGDAATAIETLLAERETAGWISVKDRLPDEKTPVLVTWIGINGKVHSDAVAAIIYGKWYWWEISAEDSLEFDDKCTFVEITHWMPLPTPP